MNTIITFLPYEEVESFKKFAEKIKKNVEGFDYTIGKPYEKLFIHPSITEEGRRGKDFKAFYTVCDLTVNMPEEKDWRLVATYKDYAFTPAGPTKELIFKKKEHGIDYEKCDVCGHRCINSYVIKVTGKLIKKSFEESFYGYTEVNTILTDKGITCERRGKVNAASSIQS